MRPLPRDFDDRNEFTPVFVRTDHSDDAAWRDVVAKLNAQPSDWDDLEPEDRDPDGMAKFLVDSAAWEGASVDDVLATLVDDEYLPVVFLADAVTMADPDRPLLAVTTMAPDNEFYAEETEFGREFRIVPPESHGLHANLTLANMDFAEWSGSAAKAPGQVFRGFGALG